MDFFTIESASSYDDKIECACGIVMSGNDCTVFNISNCNISEYHILNRFVSSERT